MLSGSITPGGFFLALAVDLRREGAAMDDEKKRRRRSWWALAGLVCGSATLLLGAYVGAYFVLVRPMRIGMRGSPTWVVPAYPECKLLELNPFFKPIHEIDRKHLRPKKWATTP
jgi:hypothetical protein